MLTDRDDWKRYTTAMRTIAAAFGTTAHVRQKNAYMAVDFKVDGLTMQQLEALALIENLIALVSEFPAGFLEKLDATQMPGSVQAFVESLPAGTELTNVRLPSRELSLLAEPTETPLSEFFKCRLNNDELPYFEMRALARIGAGLLMRHQGDRAAIAKLARLAVRFDGYRENETAKAAATLYEDAAGGPYDDDDEVLVELTRLYELHGKDK
jgi:hypothetical protein